MWLKGINLNSSGSVVLIIGPKSLGVEKGQLSDNKVMFPHIIIVVLYIFLSSDFAVIQSSVISSEVQKRPKRGKKYS